MKEVLFQNISQCAKRKIENKIAIILFGTLLHED